MIGWLGEETTGHALLLLLLHCGLLVLNLLNESLLVHQLWKGLLFIDKFESDSRILLTRVDHLENFVDRHFEAKRPQ